MKFRLQHVEYMPTVLEPGVLYVADEFGAAAHLCACGCGRRYEPRLVRPSGGSKKRQRAKPVPSIGNWQLPCRSHYWIQQGEVRWAAQWTPEEIAAGQSGEQRDEKPITLRVFRRLRVPCARRGAG